MTFFDKVLHSCWNIRGGVSIPISEQDKKLTLDWLKDRMSHLLGEANNQKVVFEEIIFQKHERKFIETLKNLRREVGGKIDRIEQQISIISDSLGGEISDSAYECFWQLKIWFDESPNAINRYETYCNTEDLIAAVASISGDKRIPHNVRASAARMILGETKVNDIVLDSCRGLIGTLTNLYHEIELLEAEETTHSVES